MVGWEYREKGMLGEMRGDCEWLECYFGGQGKYSKIDCCDSCTTVILKKNPL